MTVLVPFTPKLVTATSDQSESGNDVDNQSWIDSCYDSGYRAGQDGPFSQSTYDHCGDQTGGDKAYSDGFIDGCMSVEGNTRDVCESATDS